MPRCHPQTLRRALFAALLSTAAPALAQEAIPAPEPAQPAAAGASREVYTPADFARFSPRTALDIMEQIPGFNLGGGGGGGGGQNFGNNNNDRGFGQASENLLINGERLSSKSTSTRDQLERIAVSNVIRIEIVDGATLDIPGLSGRVANIIVQAAGISGQFEWRPQITTGNAPVNWSDATISVRGETSWMDYSLAFNGNGFARGSEGLALFRDGAGVRDERFNSQDANFDRPELSGSFGFDLGEGVSANLNLLGGLQIFRSHERENRLAGNPLPAFEERFRTANNEHFYEIGGDIEFPVGPGRLKLIALESYEHGNFRTQSLFDPVSGNSSGSRFARVNDIGERIGRGEYRWRALGADFQLSAEAAFNRLDQVGRLFVYNVAADDYREVAFPSGVGGVREDRYESILSIGFPLADGLSVQLAGGAEQSTIAQTGGAALSRTFRRPKGSISLAWAAAEGLDISLEVARRVGQLNFGDFLASVSISDDNQNAGNNQLRPQQSWETELEMTKSLGEWGSVTLELFDHRVKDLLIILPVAGGEARGNIARAQRRGLELDLTLEFAALGWQGAKLDTRLTAEDSSVIDPVIGADRRFDGNTPFEVRFDFRHDVPATPWAWGTEFRYTKTDLAFRVQEFTLTHNPDKFLALFVEHKDVFGLTVRARAGNLLREENIYQRTQYDGPRNTGRISGTEDRALEIGFLANFTISGSF